MLTLQRRHMEAIIIDGRIRVVVMIQGGKVRLGVDAPKHVTVHREEVARRIEVNGKQD